MPGARYKAQKLDRKAFESSPWNSPIQKIQKMSKYCSISFGKELLLDPKHTMTVGWLLLLVELFLNLFIVWNVPYTEIDWKAYMQECEGFLNGTLDYTQLKGDTGPLVYPAGFVYLYSILYFITSKGENIRLAQYIFIFLYLIQLYLTLKIYSKTRKVPPYAIILVTLTSYRVHSLYSLRLFNDPWAVVLFYGALHCFLNEFWVFGSILYSLAVSIKMNILLYAPCLFLVYITSCGGIKGALKHISICAIVQLILGAPFLVTNFWGYVEGSFDIKRIFEHKWTVNFRFIPRDIFENKLFHICLLFLHLLILGIFMPHILRYLRSYAKLKLMERELKPQLDTVETKNNLKNDKNEKNYKNSKYYKDFKYNKEDKDLKILKNYKKTKKNVGKLTKNEENFLQSYEKGLIQQQQGIKGTKETKNIKDTKDSQETTENSSKFTIDFSTTAQLLVLPFLVTNLIGISCARSLHYQFYCWYFQGLLYLGWSTRMSPMAIFLLLGVLEACWNTYPSTDVSSAALHLCHLILLFGIYRNMRQSGCKQQ